MTDDAKQIDSQEKPIEKLTVKELREIAKEFDGVTGIHSMKKDELIALINEQRGTSSSPAVDNEAAPTAASAEAVKTPPKTTPPGQKAKIKPVSYKTLKTKKQIKATLEKLRLEKNAAKESRDHGATDTLRRQIKKLKKMIGKVKSAA